MGERTRNESMVAEARGVFESLRQPLQETIEISY